MSKPVVLKAAGEAKAGSPTHANDAEKNNVNEKIAHVLVLSRGAKGAKTPQQYARVVLDKFASDFETVDLCAFGTNAHITGGCSEVIRVADMLCKKPNTCKQIKVFTQFEDNRGRPMAFFHIHLQRDANFKGSKIPPSRVCFLPKPEKFTALYEQDAKENFASVNAGDFNLYVGGAAINRQFEVVLSQSKQDTGKYEETHKALLAKALEAAKSAKSVRDVRLVAANKDSLHPDLVASYVRVCYALKGTPAAVEGATGVAFIDAFKADKRPNGNEHNVAMVYVVGPKGDQFANKQEFLQAVRKAAENCATAVSDYNAELRRRKETEEPLPKIDRMRVCLFSGGIYKHKDATKVEVAEMVVKGLADGNRRFFTPRLEFAYDEDAFAKGFQKATRFSEQETPREFRIDQEESDEDDDHPDHDDE